MLSKLCRTTLGAVAGLFGLYVVASAVHAQSPTNASFEVPAVTANTDSLRSTGATWTFSGQSGIRNNSAPNGSVGKQAAFLSAAPVGGNNNFGSVRQTITLKPGTYYVRYLAAVKTPSGRPQPLQFYVNSTAQGGVLTPRYLTDTTTGGFEAGWTQPFIVTTAGSYELRFDATNATNYGTVAAPLYAVAYVDAITVVSVPGAFANSGFEATSTWTLSSGATQVAAADAPEGAKVLSLASAATATQTLSLPAGRYSISLNIGKASVATGTLNVEVASNGAGAVTVATISASTAAEYRAYTTPAFALAAGTHIVTLRASGSTFSLDNIVLNDAAPDAINSGFETPVLAAPSTATAAGTTVANPTNATWVFTGTGGLIQTNAGTSNASAPRTVAGKQYLALSGTGAIAQSLSFTGGTYVAIGQVAQGGLNVLMDGTTVGKLSAATLDFREVMSAPFLVAAGTHSLGLSVDSTYTPATPKLDEIRLLRVDVPPIVSITAPITGALYQSGATVNITASASDPDGLGSLAISSTPNGGNATQLATSATSPLSTSWTNVSANSYTITATATDSTGATNATAINIRVNATPNAVVSLSPAGPIVTSASAVATTVTVISATDSDGTVTKVEFLQDGVVATTCTKTIPPAVAPFTCALSLAPRAAAYALTVRVTDNDGGVTTTAPLSLRVNTAPVVTLAAACVAPCTAPATVNLAATPTDSDGTIAKVEFYDGATLLTTKTAAPWTFSHTTAASGNHSYTAKASDNDNATTTSGAQVVSVTVPPPSVALTAACTAPCNAPAAVALTAVPANIVGTISKVEFYDGTTLLNTDTTNPYSFALTSVAAATHSYTAKVYVTGTTLAVATSPIQAVRVNALPTVTLAAACVAPCSNPATVNLTASPADSDGSIVKVEFYDGATLLTSKTASPWTYGHTSAATGSHSYTAKAFDDSGASAISTAQAITVAATPASVALTAACTAPCNAPAAITLTAVPANIVGTVSKVEFYDGATLLNTATTSPYAFAVASVAAATHSYTVKVYATGTTSAVATSTAQAVRVNALPTVSLIAACVAPCSNPATVNLTASPTDSDGSIAKVEFYDGAALLTSKTASPWTFSHSSATAGSHSYTAKAFDDSGATATSTAQSVAVAAASPSVSLTAACAPPCSDPATVTLTAVPASIGATVNHVDFYEGPGYVRTMYSGPYSVTLTAVPSGVHSYTAVVYTANGSNNTAVATSLTQTAQVTGPAASVALTASCSQGCSAPTIVTLSAAATGVTDPAAVAYFYADGVYQSSVSTLPFTFRSWPVSAGPHNYQVQIYASSGGVLATSAITPLNVAQPASTPPTLAWVSPANNATTNDLGSFVLTTAASAATGTVSGVNFYADGALLGAGTLQGANYVFTWQPPLTVGTATSSGTATIRSIYVNAVATDSAGVTASGSPTLLNISSAIQFAPPATTTFYIDPTTGNALLRVPVAVSPTPQDVMPPPYQWNGFTQFSPWLVELLENDVVVDSYKYGYERVATLPGFPFGYSDWWQFSGSTDYVVLWPANSFVRPGKPLGSYRYTIRITRAPGVFWLSPASTVTAADPSPVVTITAPSNGGSLYQSGVNLSVAVTALSPVGNVAFLEGSSGIGQCNSTTGTCTYNWSLAAAGTHTVTARATDSSGNTGNSAPVTFTVLPNLAPTVSITSPADRTTFREPATITITAVASDPDGSVTNVQFFDASRNYLGDATLANGVYSYTLTNVTAADRLRRNVSARATDNRAATSEFTPFLFLNVVGAPTAQLAYSCDIWCYPGRITMSIYMNYTVADLTRVRYLRDGVEIAVLPSGQTSYVDTTVIDGDHSYQVEITTRWSEVAMSPPVTITVAALPPSPSFVTPIGGSFANDQPVPLRVHVTPGPYPVIKVEFFVDGSTLLGQGAMSGGDYVLQWSGMSVGQHSLTATATDTRGNAASTITSTWITQGVPQAALISSPITGSEYPAGQTVPVVAGGASADPNIIRIELWRVGTGAAGADELLTTATGNALSYTLTLPVTTSLVQLYTAAFNAGGGRTQSATTTITARANFDDPRYYVWTNMNAALKAGNKAAAMGFLTPTAQENYGETFDAIIPVATTIIAGYSPIVAFSVTNTTADYFVATTTGGERLVFGLRFVLMEDGKWKLESM